MTQQDIQNLIERFLDAETTLQEEQQLMEYFRQEDIPEELMQYKEMFLDYGALLPLPREGETDTLIDSKVTTVEPSREKQPPRMIRLWAVAASIAVLMVLGVGYLYNINKVEDKPLVVVVDEKQKAEPTDSIPATTTDEPKVDQPKKKASKVKQMIMVNEDAKMYLAENTVGADGAKMQLANAGSTDIIQTEADFPILNPQALVLSEEEIAKAEQREYYARRRWLLEQYKTIQAQAEEILAIFEDEEN